MTSEEKNIYNNIRNDDKGRYKIGLQKEVLPLWVAKVKLT